MGEHLIEFRANPRGAWETWAYRVGTLKDARASALGLRRELRETNPRAQVRVNGKALRREEREA